MKYSAIACLLGLFLLFSCEEFFVSKCFSGETKVVRRTVNIEGPVKRFYLKGEAEVFIRNDDEQLVEFEFPENLSEDLHFTFENEELIFENHVTCKWRKEHYAPKLYVSLPFIKRYDILEYVPMQSLDTLKYDHPVKFYSYGPGDMELTIDMENINIQSDYVADITVKGKVENLTIYYKLHGRFFGRELEAQNIIVTHNGENDLHLNPVTSLKATIQNFGNIIIYHEPANLDVTINGKGKLIFSGQ